MRSTFLTDVRIIDSALRINPALGEPNPKKTAEIYFVEKNGKPYVLKAEHLSSPAWWIKMFNDEIIALERGTKVTGITHLVENYGRRGDWIAFLREYAPGRDLDQRNMRLKDKKLQAQLESTLSQFHSLGLADFDPYQKNIVLSPDKKLVTIVDCWPKAFKETAKPEYFQSAIDHDFNTLRDFVYA